MKITLKIRRMREAKGYSQEYMAARLGVTQSTYCKMEKDDKRINFINIDRIANVLGTETMQIIQME